MKQTLIAIVAAAIILGGGWLASRPRGGDREQVQQVLVQLADAAEHRRLSQTLSCLSQDYRGAGQSYGQVRLILLRTFHDAASVQLDLSPPKISVNGNSATASTYVHARITSAGGASSEYSSDVTFELRREKHKRWLIYPVRVWRILSAETKTEIPELLGAAPAAAPAGSSALSAQPTPLRST